MMNRIFACLIFIFINAAVNAQQVQLITPDGLTGFFTELCYSPDEKYFYTSDGNTFKCWERSTGYLVKNYTLESENGTKQPIGPALHLEKAGLIAVFGNRVMGLYNADDFTLSRRVSIINSSYKAVLYAVADSKQNTLYYICEGLAGEQYGTCVYACDVSSGDVKLIWSNSIKPEISYFSISKDDSKLLVATAEQGSILFDIATGNILQTFSDADKVTRFTPAGDMVAVKSGGYDKLDIDCYNVNGIKTKPTLHLDIQGFIPSNYIGYRIGFHAKNNWMYLATDQKMYRISLAANTLLKAADLKYREQHRFAVSQLNEDEMLLGVRYYDGGYKASLDRLDFNQNKYVQHFGKQVYTVTQMAGNHKYYELGLGGNTGDIKYLRFRNNGLQLETIKPKSGPEYFDIANDGKILVTGYNAYHTEMFDLNSKVTVEPYADIAEDKSDNVYAISYAANSRLFATLGVNTLRVFDAAQKKLIRTIPTSGYYSIAGRHVMDISADSKLAAVYAITNEGADAKYYLKCFNIGTGAELWKKETSLDIVYFTPDSKQLLLYDPYDTRKIFRIDAANGNILEEITLEGGNTELLGFSEDRNKVIYNTYSGLKLMNLSTGSAETLDERKNFFNSTGAFLKDPRYVLVNAGDNCLHLIDTETKKELAKVLIFADENEWVIITPDGHFDASASSLNDIYYTKGKEVVPLANLYEQLYTPNLFYRLINGEVLEPLDLNRLVQLPKVIMQYEAVQRNLTVENDIPAYENTTGAALITITATSETDPVEEVRLFHNGKIVQLTNRNLLVEDANGDNTVIKKYTINLLPGENSLRAVAVNAVRTESNPAEIAVFYKKEGAERNTSVVIDEETGPLAPVEKSATLYMVVVGINQYQNKSMNLNYALADAASFKEEVEKDAKTIISKVQTYFVTDKQADKDNIEKAFAEVRQNAKAEDVFIFYYAGHGVIGSDKEFYLVPSDVSNLKNVQAELEQKGIAAKLLQQFAIDIQAQKQLFILDACQSAGAFEALLTNDATQQKNIALVARSTGTHWIAASGAQQYANEFSSLGHGAFTFVLLEALKGAASKNDMITVNNLKNYLQQAVPELMKKYHGSPQYPSSYGFGNDFPVEIKR